MLLLNYCQQAGRLTTRNEKEVLRANNTPSPGKQANNGEFTMPLGTQTLLGTGTTSLRNVFRKCF